MSSDGPTRESLVAALVAATGVSGYEQFRGQVADLVLQATSPRGKGEERHARGRAWEDQPIVRIPGVLGPVAGQGYLIGQSIKKMEESLGLPPERARAELLGAAVYALAAAEEVERRQRG